MDKTYGRTFLKQAFTIAELLIVLVVIGTIAVMMITSLSKAVPDKNKTLFKKGYSVLEKSVSELVNDESLYPFNPEYPGFVNNVQVEIPGQQLESDTSKRYTNPENGNGEKFDRLFADKLNIMSEEKTNCTSGYTCYTTSDGIGWMLQKVNFGRSGTGTSPRKIVIIDTNGFGKEPNKSINEDLNGDRFQLEINFDGKIFIEGSTEQKYLSEHSLQKDKK